jgi:hypothetical protein
MEISRELFDQQRGPRFGTANAERMRLAFWEWMIRGGDSRSAEQEGVLGDLGLMIRDGKLKSGYGPWRARDLFRIPMNRADGPIWTFDRMGQTRTDLPDGRVVSVGGEHEDDYDPDFCIYNDVVVFGPTGQIEIYGYPKEVFPPTDFHTATLAGGRLIIVGCLGYPEDRRPDHTPVFGLDLSAYRISTMATSGDTPGWVFKHEARLDSEGVITIRGGEVIEEQGGECRCRRNLEDYALNIRSGVWSRLTNRNWRQFSIRQEDHGLFVLESHPELEHLLPRRVEYTVEPSEDCDRTRIAIGGVPVSITVGVSDIEIIVEGDLPDALAVRVAEEVRANTEVATRCRCVLEWV